MPQFDSSSTESFNMGTTDSDLVDFYKDIKRCIVNRELMILYGHDTTGYLPPLPRQERARSSSAPVWACSNPAMRQLSNISRRGPRSRFPGSPMSRSTSSCGGEMVSHVVLPQRPSTALSASSRPQTAYNSYIRSVLNRRVSEVARPHTSLGIFEGLNQNRATPDDLDRVIFPSQMSLRADDAMSEEEFPDHSTLDTNVAQRHKSPRRLRNNHRRKKKEKKKKIASVDAKRNADVMKVLKGDLETISAEPSTVVRVYFCANGTDMVEERRALRRLVYPELRDYCRSLELDFYVVDLKGGADTAIDQEYHMAGLYSREIKSCQQNSAGPAFLMIIGDKYGVAPLPPRIDADEFEIMQKMAEEERLPNFYLMEEWYLKDENAIPLVYVLQSRPTEMKNKRGRRRKDAQLPYTDKRVRAQFYAQLQQLLQEAILVSMEEGKILYQEKKTKYFKASVEDEVHHGILHCKNAPDQCLCYIREFSDLPRNVYNEVSRKYTDMIVREGQAKPDAQAGKFLQQLKSNVTNKLEETNNLRSYEPSLTDTDLGEESGDPENIPYKNQLVADIISDMKGLIDRAKDNLDINANAKHFEMYKVVLPHASRAKEVCEDFIGREDLFEAIEKHLMDKEKCGKPLVIRGLAGYGKTCTMGMLAQKTKKWFGSSSVVVIRFITESMQSTDVLDLLAGICAQLSVVYNMDSIPKDSLESIYKMAAVFAAYLEQVSKLHGEKKPMIILLDGLDQLDSKHRAHSLHWLPVACPVNVRIIVSVEGNSTDVIESCQLRLDDPQCFMDIGALGSDTVDLMVNTALEKAGRKLQPEQKDFLLRHFKANPHPIYMDLTIKEALTWCSYTKIDDDHVPTTAEDAVSRVLDRLETKYGLKLVQDTVSYLVLSESGLTETELTDVLSCNDEVLQDVFIQHDLPLDDIVVMPSFLLASLLDDLHIFLTRRNKDYKSVLAWRNRTYRALCAKKYFGTINPLEPTSVSISASEEAQHYCHDLAEIFLQENGVKKQFEHPMTYAVVEETDRQVTPQVLSTKNLRKLKLLPWLISKSGRSAEAVEDLCSNCFCNFNWILTKIHALGADSVIGDLHLLSIRDNDMCLMKRILKIARPGLTLDPNSLASHLLGMVPNISQVMYPGVAEVLNEARRWVELSALPLIIPTLPCLPSPLNMCKQAMWGAVEVLAMSEDNQLAVVKSKDSIIEFWDVNCNDMVMSTGMRYDRIDPNVYCSRRTVMIYIANTMYLWHIKTCLVARIINLETLLGDNLSTTIHLHNTEDFSLVVLQSSDDDFNQTLSIIDTKESSVVHKIPNFDVKDDFYCDSARFINDDRVLVFVNARSETKDDESTEDHAVLNAYDLQTGEYLYKVPLGQRKFHKVLTTGDELDLHICWADASFDIYRMTDGELLYAFKAPDTNLEVKYCHLTENGRLYFLAVLGSNDCSALYSALWCWNIEEDALEQYFIKRHRNRLEGFDRFIIKDNESYAVLSAPGTSRVWLWDLGGRKPIQSIPAHMNEVTSLYSMISDPYSFYTGSAEEGVVKRWDVYQTVKTGLSILPAFRARRSSTPGDGILKRQGSRHKLGSARSGKSVRFADGFGEDAVSSTGSSRPGTATFDDQSSPTSRNFTSEANTQIVDQRENVMLNITDILFSIDGQRLLTSYNNSLPVLWSACTGHLLRKLALASGSDVATKWTAFGSKDRFVVGLIDSETKETGVPQSYLFQMWTSETGEPVKMETEYYAMASTITFDTEKVLLATLDNRDDSNTEVTHDIKFLVLNLSEQTVIHHITYNTSVIPSVIQLTEDDKCAVTDNINPKQAPNQQLPIFIIETRAENPAVMYYEFQQGKKYPKYELKRNLVMKNGLGLAQGLNGDLQIWDIPSCEYEGNLCEDPLVKDTRNPGLHTHGGFAINQVVLSLDGRYLILASEDSTASLWDIDNEVMIHRYRGHKGQVTAVAISNDNDFVLTSGEDAILNVWQFGVTKSPVSRLQIYVAPSKLVMSSDNRIVAATGQNKNDKTRLLLFKLKNIKPKGNS